MMKVIKTNAFFALVLLLTIPVCASQHEDPRQEQKKQGLIAPVATAVASVIAKIGMKTVFDKAISWASQALPSWHTIKQIPATTLMPLAKKSVNAAVTGSNRLYSFASPYVTRAIQASVALANEHPTTVKAATSSLIATGLILCSHKAYAYWKTRRPATIAASNTVVPQATAANPALIAQGQPNSQAPAQLHDAVTTSTQPQPTITTPATTTTPAIAAATAPVKPVVIPSDTTIGTSLSQPLTIVSATTTAALTSGQQQATHVASTSASVGKKGKERMMDDKPPVVQQQVHTETDLELLTKAEQTIIKSLEGFRIIIKAGLEFLRKEGKSKEILSAEHEAYYEMYTQLEYKISALPNELDGLELQYNGIGKAIMDMLAFPQNYSKDQEQNKKQLTTWLDQIQYELLPQLQKAIATEKSKQQ